MYFDKEIDKIVEDNMMDFSQYVIKNRSLPCLYSGLKPIHLKILWTMYEDKIVNFTKSETVAGRVMAYSPHGSCYDTMVNMAQKDRHIHPLIMGHGNFGSYCSSELMYASSRYTECKLSELSLDCLEGIEKHMVDMIDNYDNTKKMPKYLPTRFPLALVMSHNGIAVGMASNTPSFNLVDVCNLTIDIINKNEIKSIIPDFATGGYILFDKKNIESINKKGIGTVKLRAKYSKKGNTIIINEIPYGSKVYVEVIIDKIIELVKQGKIKEITNVLNQTGYKGLSIEIECKKGTDLDKLMNKLYALTPLESSFSCNMNMLVGKNPKVLGVYNVIEEWLKFRRDCIKRGLEYEVEIKSKKLHLLKGLERVLVDIDKAIELIRKSDEEAILDNLMNNFNIDDQQAQEISNMKLRNINKNYILKQIQDISNLIDEINNMKDILSNPRRIDEIIIKDLRDVSKKYGQPRKTEIIYEDEISTTSISKEDLIEDYNCRILFTKDGYIKKYLRQSDNHKLKDGDVMMGDMISTNKSTLLIFTNKANRYRLNAYELDTMTPQSYGSFIRNIINLEDDEEVIKVVSIEKEVGYMSFIYDTGKLAKVNIKSYLSNNKKLQNCFNIDSKLIAIEYIKEDVDCLLVTSEGKVLITNTNNIASKGTRNSQGNVIIKLPENITCIGATINISTDDKFVLKTAKGKSKEFLLDDIAPTGKTNEERTLFTYLYGRSGVQGNFVINTRNSEGEFIIKYIKI